MNIGELVRIIEVEPLWSPVPDWESEPIESPAPAEPVPVAPQR